MNISNLFKIEKKFRFPLKKQTKNSYIIIMYNI